MRLTTSSRRRAASSSVSWSVSVIGESSHALSTIGREGSFEIACPSCSHKLVRALATLASTGAFFCPKCDETITVKNQGQVDRKIKHVVLNAKSEDGTYSANWDVVVRSDGFWMFSAAHEHQVVDSLELQSDRAVAVILGSLVEGRLEMAIRSRLRRDVAVEKQLDRMFRPSGPLGAFSNKIDLAFIMGLVTDAAYRDLVKIKDIRNAFAHHLDIRDFASASPRDLANNLKMVDTHIGNAEDSSDLLSFDNNSAPRIWAHRHSKRRKVPRDRYVMAVQLFLTCLGLGAAPFTPAPYI